MHPIARKYYCTLVCPYDGEGNIDQTGYRQLVRYFMAPRFRHLGGICVNPEAGEIHYLLISH
jgi:dihydrodipicolinate synthase/N-acetylneuraminate lyase